MMLDYSLQLLIFSFVNILQVSVFRFKDYLQISNAGRTVGTIVAYASSAIYLAFYIAVMVFVVVMIQKH